MGNAVIAGPRRTKQQAPPAPPAAQPVPRTAPVQNGRQLPPLDYDEPTRASRPAAAAQIVTMPARRGKVHRFRWFILGIAFGALGAVFARGEATQTLHDLRVWSARALRSLERTTPPPSKVQPSSAAPSAKPVALATDAPCPMNPGPGDPCAELLAPFVDPPKPPVPTVSIEALPRVKPPVIARHHRHVSPAAAPAPAPASTAADDSQEPLPTDDDESTSQVTTAENDPPPVQ
ncbi:MAG TPA: hypothetical protein VF765_26870 [Polyangiaceae bacterium]